MVFGVIFLETLLQDYMTFLTILTILTILAGLRQNPIKTSKTKQKSPNIGEI